MNSRDYWRKRELEHIEAMNAAQKDYGAEFARINERAIRNIEKEIEAFYGRYAEKEGISISVAKKKVSSMDVQAFSNKAAEYVKNENFSDEANEALRLYNLTMKVNRLELLKSACALELVNMGDEYQKYMGKVLTAEAEAEAKRQAGILGKTLDTTDIENAKKIVTGSWKNATFSERIWGNNASLKNNLNNLLTSGIIAGKHPTALARDLRKQFDVTRYEAERLMRTESSRIQGEIAISNYEADGVTEYE
ncbi:MAG: phage head morphogenesis protein, partial [Eubacterium sp.]